MVRNFIREIGSLRKSLRAGIPSTKLTPDFAGLFWPILIADAPHHPPPGRRSSYPVHAYPDAFRRRRGAPDIQPLSKAFDTELHPTPSAFGLRSCPSSRRLLFTAAGVVSPDLSHRDLASPETQRNCDERNANRAQTGFCGKAGGRPLSRGTAAARRPATGLPQVPGRTHEADAAPG